MPGFAGTKGKGIGPPSVIETARKHRWKFVGYLGKGEDITFFAKRVTRPTIEIDEIKIHHGQDEICVPGKNRWSVVEITFYEAVASLRDFVAQKIYAWWSSAVLDIKKSAIVDNPKIQCELMLLDGRGFLIYQYLLYGCWPIKVTPCELDYTVSDICDITLTLRVDKVEEKVATKKVNIFYQDAKAAGR